ncbi:hypothetical protein GE21DRAFT_3540 [Neurospora crassa]|uniref:Uncharacterized protein n=2 Tax=Neurospora crassa TaxID=5141 RepID=Q1K8Q2_NEUCR|nr:hypothetical protein NCU08492 [Neurospora crassa OR74A]EAA34185.1 hypothetical protein NCU08492 [Neurospora crassa OR74A]KHE80708.1 hypothetical protein GE21DRAFT_3540 [Neurospora crassa]CAB92713.2 hypothetical protein [Neurospora crassa]|eukprot:XP_963421.1 hypothetical protein NCU08492 [Neurospora crassa OR74A]
MSVVCQKNRLTNETQDKRSGVSTASSLRKTAIRITSILAPVPLSHKACAPELFSCSCCVLKAQKTFASVLSPSNGKRSTSGLLLWVCVHARQCKGGICGNRAWDIKGADECTCSATSLEDLRIIAKHDSPHKDLAKQ